MKLCPLLVQRAEMFHDITGFGAGKKGRNSCLEKKEKKRNSCLTERNIALLNVTFQELRKRKSIFSLTPQHFLINQKVL